MEKELKLKVKMLEAKKMKAQYNADMQEKIYAIYKHLPLIIYLFIIACFLIYGIIDSFTHEVVVFAEDDIFQAYPITLYGNWQLETRFHVYFSWTLIGAFLGAFLFLVLKTVVSVRIMTLEYLRMEAIDKQLKEKKALLEKLPPQTEDY